MGIMDFVRGGVREMMIARPDRGKHLLVYKHGDRSLPFWAQVTVDSDECAVFFKDGQYKGHLPPGRHTLQTENIPFLLGLVNNSTGGDRFVADVFFVKMQPIRYIPLNGPLEQMEDPILHERVTPRITGAFALVVVDPARFVTGYRGQAAGAEDQDAILSWIRGLYFKTVKAVIGQVCVERQKSLLNVGAMTMQIAGRLVQSAPDLDEIGVKVLEIEGLNIHFSAEEQKLLRDAERSLAEGRRGVGIAADMARAKQAALEHNPTQDWRYAQQLAGTFPGYAAGAGLPPVPPQWLPPHLQQPAPPTTPQAPPAVSGAPTIEQRLARLTELKAKGLISDEDFQARKAKILEDI